jgi:regulator of ribonuclease activity A
MAKKNIYTADLCDTAPDELQIVEDIFKDYGATKNFYGEIVTVKIFEDNSFVKKALAGDGTGKVLVIDGGGSKRRALVGGNLGVLAVENNWNGIIVFGAIRDTHEFTPLELGVKALGVSPMKTEKRNEGQQNIPVKFGGVTFKPGNYVYADLDGIVVSESLINNY